MRRRQSTAAYRWKVTAYITETEYDYILAMAEADTLSLSAVVSMLIAAQRARDKEDRENDLVHAYALEALQG